MSISELGSLGEFVAAFAVLVTLIFLTLQMRQTREATRSAAELAVTAMVSENTGKAWASF